MTHRHWHISEDGRPVEQMRCDCELNVWETDEFTEEDETE